LNRLIGVEPSNWGTLIGSQVRGGSVSQACSLRTGTADGTRRPSGKHPPTTRLARWDPDPG